MKKFNLLMIGAILLSNLMGLPQAFSEEDYRCEIMTVQGTASVVSANETKPVKEGDLLKEGDQLKVEAGSYVDVAYDKQWNNITRIGENSDVTIKSIYPTGLKMKEGDIFAKLHRLPKGTTFEIQTPVAVAAVRGSEYFTEHRGGETKVFNYSPSPVEVFSFDKGGQLMDRTMIQESEKTEIKGIAEAPRVPEKMSPDEMKRVDEKSGGMEVAIKEAKEAGRESFAPDVKTVEQDMVLRGPFAPSTGAPANNTTDGTAPPKDGDDHRPKVDGGGPGGDGGTPGGPQGPNSADRGGNNLMKEPPPMTRFNDNPGEKVIPHEVLNGTAPGTGTPVATGTVTPGTFGFDPNKFNLPPGTTTLPFGCADMNCVNHHIYCQQNPQGGGCGP